MANEIITTLHPDQDPDTNLYPNIKKDNIPDGSIDLNKLDDNVISFMGSLKPSGVDTSSNILSKTSDDGIWIGSDTGKWYYWDGSHYVEGGVYQSTQISPNSINKTMVDTTIMAQGDNVTSTSVLSDFNNASVNRTYLIQSTQLNNKPVNKGGILITNGYNNNWLTQTFITTDGEIYKRQKFGGNFNNWILELSVSSTNIVKRILTNDITDFNNASINTIYTIGYTNLDNQPVAEFGTLFTFGSSSNYKTQIYISVSNNFYYRIDNNLNHWTDWKMIDRIEIETSSISLFERIGVIGDSFASGEIFVGDTHHDYYNLSWIQMIARRNGIHAENYSVGGLTTKTWLTNGYGLHKLNNTTPDNLYILALGINDQGSTIGSISDIHDEDPSLNPDTFYGNYGKIVEAIKTHSPNCKIIFSTLAKNNLSTHIEINTAIVNIANHYNVPVIYQYNDSYFKSSRYLDTMVNGHPTGVGYGEMAKALERLINDCMSTNRTYFDDYVG